MISTIWVLITTIISYNHAEFIQYYRPFSPATAPAPLLCRAQQLLTQISPSPLQQAIPLSAMPQHVPNRHHVMQHRHVQEQPLQHQHIPEDLFHPEPSNDRAIEFKHFSKSTTSSDGLKFLLPFVDIDIEIDRKVFILQEPILEDIFILHGHELFQLFLSRQEKRLSLMCYLEGSLQIMETQAAEILRWQGHLVLVVALDDRLEIYQLRRDVLQSRAEVLKDSRRLYEPAPIFPAAQQLSLQGKIQRFFIIAPGENQLMIVAAVNFSKVYGKIRTFLKTKNTFEPMEELTVPALNVVNVVGAASKKYLIIGKFIKNKTKTILTVYEIDVRSYQLRNIQMLTVDSPLVHTLSFGNKNLLIACSNKQTKCPIYTQLRNGTFTVFRERNSPELAFNHLVSSSKLIMASKRNQIMAFTDHFLDSFGSFTPDLSDISQVMGHHNSQGEHFVLVVQKSPFRLLIRTVEVEINDKYRRTRQVTEEQSELGVQHKLFLKSLVDRARSFLPPRKEDMNIFHRMAHLMLPKSERFETKKTPSNNPFERFMEMFVPKKQEPEEFDIIDMFENVFSPQAKKAKSSESKMDLFGVMDDIMKTSIKEGEYKDPLTNMFENFVGLVRPRRNVLESEEPVQLKSGNIEKIKIQNEFLKSPKEILNKVNTMKNIYLTTSRGKRSDAAAPYNITLELRNHVKVKKVRVKHLIYQKEVIKGISINSTSTSGHKLIVTSPVATHRVNASQLIYPDQKRDVRQFVPDLYYDLSPFETLKHLNVESINGLAWSDFYESIFLKNRDTAIKGRLVMQSHIHVDHLTAPLVNDVSVDRLFNLRQPQVIKSNLVISRFLVHDLKAERVNDLKFEEDIVFSGKEAYVETPVTMHHLRISGDLFVADKKIERVSENADETEFQQFYTNKVVINGTLVIDNLKRENGNGTKIIVGSKEFQEDAVKKKYLLKNEAQVTQFIDTRKLQKLYKNIIFTNLKHFLHPVVFESTKVTAPLLQTKYLNDYPTADHMLTDTVNNTKPLLIVFMKSLVLGDIICRDYKSKIAEINENLIRTGEVATITGIKKFMAPMATDQLEALQLNNVNFMNFVFKTELKTPIKFMDSKKFNKIMVRNPIVVEQGIDAVYLNSLPLDDLLNHDYHMDRLHVPHTLSVSNMVFHKINGIPFDEFFMKLGVADNRLVLHKDLIVEGNVVFVEPVQLELINDLQWNDYVENLARTHEQAVIEGTVNINGDLVITEDLWSKEINSINLPDIFENILRRSKPQLITGHYTFANMKASNVDLLSINGRLAKEYVDLSNNFISMNGDITAPKIIIKGRLSGSLDQPFTFDNLSESVKRFALRPWRNIRVMKNATWSQDAVGPYNIQQELLKYLYKNAVRSNQNQVISGNVKVLRPVIKNMITRLQFPSNIDLKFIHDDAVKKNSTSVQYIRGLKSFSKPIYCNSLEARYKFIVSFLNNIDIIRFNFSLYRLSSKEPLQARLQFIQPLVVGHLALEGFINGLNSSLIYEIKNNSILPAIEIEQLSIANDITVKTINHMNLQYFLDNRVTLKGAALEIFGFLKFENLVIENNALLQSINNIAIDNLVFRHSSTLQTFTGHKSVTGFVELAGPAHVMHLNGNDLMELYRNTLITNRDYEFDRLSIDKVTLRGGLQLQSGENLRQRTFDEDVEEPENRQNFIELMENINQNINNVSDKILYLDYARNASVKWQNSYNLSIDSINLKEIERISSCEKQFVKLSFSNHDQTLYLENVTSNRLSKFSNNIGVKVENYCKTKYRKVKSKISITSPKLLKIFGLKRYVEAIDILSFPSVQRRFVVLHALDLPALKRNEVRVFKLDSSNNSISDWQGLTQNIGEKLKVFQSTNSSATLITNGLVNNQPAVTIYNFNLTREKFKLQQIIDGDYDIIEMLQLHSDNYHQLIISCRGCEKVFIYDFDGDRNQIYAIYQILALKTKIDKLFVFSLKRDNYLLVLSENESGFYYLYRYSHLRGWVLTTYGYFPNLKMSISLTDLWSKDDLLKHSDNCDSIPLLVLCNLDNCRILNAIIQK